MGPRGVDELPTDDLGTLTRLRLADVTLHGYYCYVGMRRVLGRLCTLTDCSNIGGREEQLREFRSYWRYSITFCLYLRACRWQRG